MTPDEHRERLRMQDLGRGASPNVGINLLGEVLVDLLEAVQELSAEVRGFRSDIEHRS